MGNIGLANKDYLDMAHAFDSMTRLELEHWRMAAENRIADVGGMEAVSKNAEYVKCVLQQSIAANLLNDKYGKSYDVADFDEHGNVYMRQPEPKAVSERPLPSYSLIAESAVEDELQM